MSHHASGTPLDWLGRIAEMRVVITNYKCFGKSPAGFEGFHPLNLIIGRNNSGKSSLVDLAEYLFAPSSLQRIGGRKEPPEVMITQILQAPELKSGFRLGMSGGAIRGDHWAFGKQWIGKGITWRLKQDGSPEFVGTTPETEPDLASHFLQACKALREPLNSKKFLRLHSERDIRPEPGDHPLSIDRNGVGATTVIRQYLTRAALPSNVVNNLLLAELNAVCNPDMVFSEIKVQELEDGNWEVYLCEKEKGQIPLSRSGSGLKTILLVLLYLHVLPLIEKAARQNCVFAFEELENNLHPASQRRLLGYIHQMALREHFLVFITTHSSAVIDLFSKDEASQIIHITHDGEASRTSIVRTYLDRCGILDDLDVRASDLLQSNGVVWVEGPSDATYLRRWIELWTDGDLRDGEHFQIVFYGGKLLSYLTAYGAKEPADDLLDVLRVNRNAAIIIDSDKDGPGKRLRSHKSRLCKEFAEFGGMAWVTHGREIENYIPIGVLQTFYKRPTLPPLERFEKLPDYLEKHLSGEGERFRRNKVLYATQWAPLLSKDELAQTFDLATKMDRLCQDICRWNGIEKSG